ncbi:S-layer homology domain-containing protein [Cohnella hashimotonis]|uniref:S-layer homology domain-containing protein n=1 Tax=Cohnella hashimotonis TaxID=2826895 RepID=A0ABT6TS36_9BACL|nr:S-layer homology domain-containing protein [Cohnella hashimotonis]MDI4649661.1 S-layer homology domain-containing protein [Cohnella hashimotonis]
MKNFATLRRPLALLLTLALILPFVRLPAASAEFVPLYDTLNSDNPPAVPAYRSLPSGSYVATPFRINNAYGEISAVMLNAKYENESRPSITKAKMSVAIFSDDDGKPGAVLGGALGSYELDDQIDLGGPANPFSRFYISLEQPAKLYRDRQYWVVYGTSDADAARVSLVGVNEQPLPEGQGTNNLVTDTYQPARVVESSRVIYSLQHAGTDIAVTDWSGAQRTDGQIVPFVLDGWVSEPHENLNVQFATDTMAHVFFGQSPDATEVVLEQSEDEGATWTVADAGALDKYSNDAVVTGLKPETSYQFRLIVKDGFKGGVSNTAQADTLPDTGWRLVGDAGFSGQLVRDTELVLDAAGVPYIAYVDQAMTGKIIVKKYTGAAWESVGTEASDEQAASVSLALDSYGRPYIAYTASADSLLTVRKFDGTAWSTVGQVGIGEADLPDLKLDAANRPYVAYRDLAGPLGGAITVAKFSDGSWQPAGAAQFTPETSVQRLSLAIGKDGIPYVGYSAIPDGSYSSYKPFVYRLVGGVWTDMGYSGFGSPHSAAFRISLAASPIDGALYAVFDDTNANRKPSVIRWNGSDWEEIGSPGIAPRADALRIAVDSQGVPYVAYTKRNEGGGPVSVLRWSGTEWVDVGGADFSGGDAYDISLAVDFEGRPYVSYADQLEGEKSTVKVYPKPISNLSAARSGDQVLLGFDKPSGASQVVVLVSADGGMSWETATTLQPLDYASGTATVTGLSTGTAYLFKLAVVGGSRAGDSNASPVAALEQVEAVTASPAAGAVASGTAVALASQTDGAVIRYTTDGAEPTADSPVYEGPIVIDAAKTIRAIAWKDGMTRSAVASFAYTIAVGSAPTTVSPSVKSVTLNVVDDKGALLSDPLTKLVGSRLALTGQLLSADGQSLGYAPVTIKSGQPIQLPSLAAGTYKLVLNVVAPDGDKLAGKIAKLTIDAAGNATISSELIDPYGIVTDALTGKTLDGVKTTLHWSDTALNKSKGRKPGALVELPELPDFAPNQNRDPQISTDGGKYGWMVYPDGDYYILGERDGYVTFDSRLDTRSEQHGEDSYLKDGNIHVGQAIVEYSFKMMPKASGSGTHEAYMKGYPDGSFKSAKGVSRAELAAVLTRTMTQKETGNKAVAFKDVSAKHWAAAGIRTAAAQGWMKGYAGGLFKPEGQVTRAELAQALSNLYGWKAPASGASSFSDTGTHWANEAIAAVQAQGIMQGYEDGTFRPDQAVTRAEAVKVFNQLLGRSPGQTVGVPSVWNDLPDTNWAYSDIMEASVTHSYVLYETGLEQWGK